MDINMSRRMTVLFELFCEAMAPETVRDPNLLFTKKFKRNDRCKMLKRVGMACKMFR